MKLWRLGPIPTDSATPGHPFMLGRISLGHVVRAESEDAARQMVAAFALDEGAATWLDRSWTYCDELTNDGESELVLSHSLVAS